MSSESLGDGRLPEPSTGFGHLRTMTIIRIQGPTSPAGLHVLHHSSARCAAFKKLELQYCAGVDIAGQHVHTYILTTEQSCITWSGHHVA